MVIKKNTLISINITCGLFYIWFIAYELLRITTISDCDWARQLYFGICLICLLIQIYDFFAHFYHTRKKLILLLFVSICILISYICSKNMFILQSFWLVAFANKIDFKELAHKSFWIRIGVLCFTVLIAINNVIDINTITRSNGIVRYSFGFNHPNRLSALILSIIVAFIIYKWDQIKFYHLVIFNICAYIVNELTNSKSAVISIVILSIIIMVFKYINDKKFLYILQYILLTISLLFPAISVYLSYTYNSNNIIYVKLNQFLSGRIMLSNALIKEYGTSLFGKVIDYESFSLDTMVVLDNAYILTIIRYGIIVMIIIEVVYIISIRDAIKKENYAIVCGFFIFAVYGLMESSFINLGENFMFMYFINIIGKYSVRKKKKGCLQI